MSSLNSDKPVYNAIDAAKFLCAIMIVMIHIAPLGENETFHFANFIIKNWGGRTGVPFFFITSGYFLYRKTNYENFIWQPTKNYLLKILRLYILWTIIYFPLCLGWIINNKNGTLHAFLGWVRDFLFTGSYTQLWYLNATIVGGLLCSFLLYKRIKIKYILIIAGALYAVGLLAQSWFGVIRPIKDMFPSIWSVLKIVEKVIVTTRNGVFEAFLFMSIGMLFAFKKIKFSKRAAVTGFSLSYLLMLAELIIVSYFNFSRKYDMYVFLVPTSFFMFYIVKNMKLENKKIYPVLWQLSMLIFLLHLWIEKLVSEFFGYCFDFEIESTCWDFIITLIITIAASLLIIRLSENRRFQWLKRLYS